MRVLIALVLVVAAAAAPTEDLPDEWASFEYHRTVGIPSARRLMLLEAKAAGQPGRVVGGDAVSVTEYPYQAGLDILLTDGQPSLCGASLLSNTRLVTAAHCWWDGTHQARQLIVVLGSNHLYSGGTRVVTTSVVVHENWDRPTISNDIAIISISWVNFGDTIQPIGLPSGSELERDFVGEWPAISGWGKISDFQLWVPYYQFLNHASVQVITNAACQEIFPNTVRETSICTSGEQGANPCSGDSGGPLALDIGGRKILIGVISFGSARGCMALRPSVYTRITSFVPWILQHL